jgi:hypothetical protein
LIADFSVLSARDRGATALAALAFAALAPGAIRRLGTSQSLVPLV